METEDSWDYYDEIIRYDARHGYKESLERYLKHKPESINKLYEYKKSKLTLLAIATRHQHEDIVSMLITEFKADVEIESYLIKNEDSVAEPALQRVTPLLLAAFHNNTNIVRLLVEYGLANVNHLSSDGIAPLHAACRAGNLEIVQYLIQNGANPHQLDKNGWTILISACYFKRNDLTTYIIDETDCDLNHQDSNGKTALYYTVKYCPIECTKILLEHGALNLRCTKNNLTPLMWAAIHGKREFVEIFKGHCSDIEWIEALELLGSTFAGCRLGIENINMAVEYLTRAFEARESKHIPKLPFTSSLDVFDRRQECQTLEDFNQLLSSGLETAIYSEALFIYERFFGTLSHYYCSSILCIGSTFYKRNQNDMCIRLLFYECDLRRRCHMSLGGKILFLFVSFFNKQLTIKKAHIFVNELCKILNIMADQLDLMRNNEDFDRILANVLHLVKVAAHLLFVNNTEESERISIDDGRILFQHIRSIVNKNYVTAKSGASLLHLCCDENTTEGKKILRYIAKGFLFRYPCSKTAQLLVRCGIDIDAMDSAGNTALQITVKNQSNKNTSDMIDFLIDRAGVHLDFANDQGNSPLEYLRTNSSDNQATIQRLYEKSRVSSLKCRCARLAKRRWLPYQRCLAPNLANFVRKH